MDIQAWVACVQLALAPDLISADKLMVHQYQDNFDREILVQVNNHFSKGVELPDYRSDSFIAFILSKPTIKDETISLHAFRPKNKPGELWIKMKSRLSFETDPDTVIEELTDQLVTDLQQRLLQCAGLDASELSARLKSVIGGPAWLASEIDVVSTDESVRVYLPAFETAVDVPERFAGHFYIKLLGPEHPAIVGALQAN
ncbi:hypothetical protein [Oceanicoccus sp. KOV_DT_Chl]|uniref:hypothetical protein n=1 Tax=Oceanicoccus sp. KOV_DT_Chl TaxID=1904639 RepID=UPI000C7CC455|nr:hypothetical protein [Oceanicoccus sp. KOV_DT_Chl]